MTQLVNALILFMSLGCKAHIWRDPGMVYGFENVTAPKLEVPLDYSNTGLGTTSIAFIKLAGKNATAESPSIVINPGGPGGSGVDLLLMYRTVAGQMFGEHYNFVSFDPRGVNNSDLRLDCFSGKSEARLAFRRLHSTGATNISSTSLEEQYYSSSIYGEWCNNAVDNESPHAYYVTTPAVAHDLLTFIEAEAEVAGQSPADAKLWCYGVSYGTVIGSTFASMFPDRVGRMILDGVVNAEQYYNNEWRDNVDQMDEAMKQFSSFCHSAGPGKCSFWGPTPANITARLDGILHQLQNHPVPVSGVQNRDLPTLVTYSDLKALFLNTIYAPLKNFPVMADILRQLERGDVSALAGMFDGLNSISDARLAIQCADSYRRNRLTTMEEFQSYVGYTISKSKYIGDIYPIYQENILCRSFRPKLPDNMVVQGRARCRPSLSDRYFYCKKLLGQKLRCDRTAHRTDTSTACDRCARNNLTCVTSAPMPMGRPRSLNPKRRYSRKSSKASDETRSTDTRADSSTPPSSTTTRRLPELVMGGMDAMNELPELGFNEGDMGYDMDFPSMNVFDASAFADLAMGSQPDAVGPTDFTAVNPQEQNIERLWKLHSTLLEHVYRMESQGTDRPDPCQNGSSADTHPLGSRLSDVANTQSDHPMHQVMRCSQTFLEIIQSFVSSYRESVCSIPPPDRAATDSSRDSDDEDLMYHDNHRPVSAPAQDTSSWFTLPTLDNLSTASPPGSGTGRNQAWSRGGQEKSSSNSHPDKKQLRRPQPALPPACQTQFPICLTITTCYVLLIRLYRSVLTDLYASVRSFVARYTPAGDLTGPLAVLDNFSGSAPFSNVHLDGSTLKLDGVLQITVVLQLSCDLLERIDRGVEILLTGAGHILSAPGTYMSVLEALAQQEARSGRGPAVPDWTGSAGGRAARLVPLRMLVKKIRKCINDTCL
ncbi:hypothetical protein CNMCM7691_004466 [Aspergillus felis]|uniref:AB hydrolase-1 domain-containing protein n=1 Tax=Aspergillus felis TaxID=1287682 RepID=A0A8H6R140_9EURO|nr:hypothetical protein CNMCM7691_004466 [Aspergillus felis]